MRRKSRRARTRLEARIVHLRLLVVQLESAGSEAVFGQHLDELKKFLGTGPLKPEDAAAAVEAAKIAEETGNDRLAGDTLESMAKLLAADPTFAGLARAMQAKARRMKLVGNAMHLEGKTLDGTVLNWAKYRGKVVLIDFWATWCGPCREEIPNIKANYEKFQRQGFEVIGISIDEGSSMEIGAFVKKEEVPWTICRDADLPEPMADYYGITSIPQMILVGRDGRVIALNARGSTLGPLVEKALAVSPNVAAVADPEEQSKAKHEKAQKKPEDKAAVEAAAQERRELAAKAQARTARTWTDASGNFRVTAKFRGMVNEVVKLEREDGTVINVPLEKLSEADQECIRLRKY